MHRNLFASVIVCMAALFLTNCGHEQTLVSITIQPSEQSFGATDIPVPDDAGANVQLRALGSYIHPVVTKDVTNQATWASNTTDIATVSSTGVLTATGKACGSALVSATVTTNKSEGNISSQGAIVTGYMTATVVCFSGISLTVDFAGPGSGTVISTPPGVSCASSCSGSFSSGTNVTLTANPSTSSSFGGWAGCDGLSGNECTVNDLTTPRAVTVTFN